MKKRDIKKKKLTLTVAAPFQLRTEQRGRDEDEVKKEEYEPLWMQVQKCFRLREEESQQHIGVKRGLTRPRSPTLHVTKRMKLRDDMNDQGESQEESRLFKARPLNKRIFEKRDEVVHHSQQEDKRI